MKRTVLIFITAVAFLAGLFVAGQVLGAGQETQTHQSRLASTNLNPEQISEMQNLLIDRGFNTGTTDGIIGPRTQEALRQFQTSEGLTVTGMPNRETLRALAPDIEQQQFFGVAPEYGEIDEPMRTKEEQAK